MGIITTMQQNTGHIALGIGQGGLARSSYLITRARETGISEAISVIMKMCCAILHSVMGPCKWKRWHLKRYFAVDISAKGMIYSDLY